VYLPKLIKTAKDGYLYTIIVTQHWQNVTIFTVSRYVSACMENQEGIDFLKSE